VKGVQRLLDLADHAKTLMCAINDVFDGEVGDAGGIEPLREKAAQIGRRLPGFGGSLRVLLGEGFEVFDGGGALGVFEIEIV